MDKYTVYLKSSQWQQRRIAKLEQARYRCEKCGERDGLEVHHKTYERLGNERNDDLIVLCKSCHWAADEKRRGNQIPLEQLNKPQEKSIWQLRVEEYERREAGKRERKRLKREERRRAEQND